MSELRFGTYETATGRLLALESSRPSPPAGVEVIEFDPPMNIKAEMWDPASRNRVPRPAKVLGDVYADLIASLPGRGFTGLNGTNRTILRQALVDFIGPKFEYNAATGWTKDRPRGVVS